jgi:isopentenyl-diphosphate Delta-isomerase
VDDASTIAQGHVPGAVAAAVRKLEHELGIPRAESKKAAFQFLTRLVYCAPDRTIEDGKPTGWGEHEMDYILFVQADLPLKPNADEVADVRHVTSAELKLMMRADSGLSWSPWFRIISQNFLDRWWADLPGVFAGKHADWESIHEILPHNGAGAA